MEGKADQQTLQRVYGIAFPKASMLKVRPSCGEYIVDAKQ